ncbi:MAG: hypothetical protein HONBIEJF_02568 [Fimbriimonadaceae bacterium]|nr:hypothetical protein [Fimbriimonadaceae bacterium]
MTDQERNNQIATFSRDYLSPTKEQRAKVSTRYEELKGFLKGSCFMSGSYARFTAVRPPKDLDVIWVCFDERITLEPRPILDALTEKLIEAYRLNSNERVKFEVQDHSITIIFLNDTDDFSIDVVPAAETGRKNEFGDPIYCVPEIQKLSHIQRRAFHGTAQWIYSDPRGYIVEAQKLEDQTDGRFRRSAKVVKAWRQKHKKELGDDFKLKSFHVEQLVVRHLQLRPGDTILQVLRAIFGSLNRAIEAPAIPDRANSDAFIDQYVADLTYAEKAKILSLQQGAFRIVAQLEAATSDEEIDTLMTELTQVAGKESPAFVAPAVVIARPAQPYGKLD